MRSRKGLSTVVGAIFFVIAASSTIGYVTYSMNTVDRYNQSVLEKNQEDVERSDEQFKITRVTVDNNKFNITIQNTGSLPVNITRLWVENTTDTDDIDRVFKYDIKKAVYPGENVVKVGQTLPFYVKSSQAYDLKLVTERGNEQEFSVNSANAQPLQLQLFATPEKLPTGFTTTLLLAVTNNMSNNGILTNLVPILTPTDFGSTSALASGPEPTSVSVLEQGNTAFFKWTYTVSGEPGEYTNFEARLTNGYPGNTVTESVYVDIVSESEQSQTSLKSLGLGAQNSPDDILYFHLETTDALTGRQLKPVNTDSTGQTIQLDTTNAMFYTQNDTAPTINIPSGGWNAYLRYLSAPLPDSLLNEGENMIFHFENGPSNPDDSTSDDLDLELCTGGKQPTYEPTNGPNGTGTYHFTGAQCIRSLNNVENNKNDIGATPDTTALWFKLDTPLPTTKQTLVRWEKNGGSPVKYYEISVPGTGSNAGKIVFEFNTQSTGSGEITTCVSNNAVKRVDDGNWHHVVAVRKDGSGNPQQKCELYIDGILHSSVQSPHNTPNMEADGKWYVGSNRAENADFFKGRIDDIIHWNSKALDATEALDLFKTSYGENAHKVTFKIDKTDKDGNLIQNLRTNSSYPLDFLDGDGKYNSPSAADWKWFNFTTPTIDSVSLTNQRIRFNM
ncbi:MAG TPA: LamG-like jellyroll fold domain-containing protein, partial [Nitrosopumilaceae archaeon]|nr:LamG-like jellyroll fold domain-containing protein [Nitrosopumilaceae archaeon]